MANKQIIHGNHIGIDFTVVGEEVRAEVTLVPVDGEDGVGVPAGGSAGQKLAKIDAADYNTHWVDDDVNVIEGIAGGDGFVDVSGSITLDLASSRVFYLNLTGTVTAWSFTNVPLLTARSPSVRIVWRQDATGGHAVLGGPTLAFRDGCSMTDISTAANAENELLVWHVGTELRAVLSWNGRLDLDPIGMSFEADGSQLYTFRRAETVGLGDVTNLEEDGTAGTGTLTFARNGTTVTGEQEFAAGQVLKVTLASSTTPTSVSIPRWIT